MYIGYWTLNKYYCDAKRIRLHVFNCSVFLAADIAIIVKNFSSNRQNLPLMFIVTEYNKTSHYTRHYPTPPMLQRIVKLAFKSLSLLNEHCESHSFFNIPYKVCML